jgi:fatty-acyl-CoA synthase
VCVTHGNLAINAAAIARSVGAGPHDVGVNWLPLFHDMGLFGSVIVPLVCRMPVVHMPTAAFAAQPRRWMEAMSRHGGTYAFAPNFAYALAARRTPEPARLALSQVRMLGCAAEPISAATLRAFEAHFAPAGLRQGSIVPCYGMAEATVAISFCAPGAPLRVDALEAEHYRVERRAQRRGAGEAAAGGVVEVVACGAVIEGHALRVVDDDLQPLPDRHVGEIVFEGPSVTAGYWREPERTAEVYVAPQTIRTGDLGYLADGQIYVTGRRKDLLIVRGRNVDPQDVERIATEQPGVRAGNAVAFSIPSDETELVVVIAETKEAPTPELAAAIQRAVHQALALPVADVQLVAAGAIHKTSSGKLQRARMRAEYLARRAAAPPQDDGGGSP